MKEVLTASPRAMPVVGRAHALLQPSYLLRGASPAVIAELAGVASIRELRAGETLWREGEPARSFHVIGRGLVRCRRYLRSGSEVTLGIFGPRESIGDTAVLEDRAYPAEAVVVSDGALVAAIPARPVLELSTVERSIAEALQHALLRHSAVLRTKVAIVSAGPVRARLANLFLHLAERFGETRDDGTVVIPLVLARGALASLVSARTETVIRGLRPWEVNGVVVTTAEGFRIGDLDALRACVDDG
ncbi:MAG: Crp/Fnr family transcriptional regulator [Deltaproteobacteria bacterium]|nr:Crp/Fnr family transcriptional regulator [Kofleriaceae bacterium]